MNNQSFDYQRIAEGYAKRPFLHKEVFKRLKEDLSVNLTYQNGLDVGCGAGLSTKALKSVCAKVTGTDISAEMVQVAGTLCSEDGYSFARARAEDIVLTPEPFDIVTAAGVINWVDEALFLTNLKKSMTPHGLLLIYDFWITDRMLSNPSYTDWWHQEYLKHFPKPPRKEYVWTQEIVAPYGFHITKQVTYEFPYEFDLDSFIEFMLLQSNVIAQIEEGKQSLEDVTAWFYHSLAPIWQQSKEILFFDGYSWYIEPSTT